MRGEDQLVDDVAMGRQNAERALLVGMHEARVAVHVGRQDRGELALRRWGFRRPDFQTCASGTAGLHERTDTGVPATTPGTLKRAED